MSTPGPSFAVGDRVELRDPPHSVLHGVIVDMSEHAIHVRWDDMWDHHEPAIVGHAATNRHGSPVLFPEGAPS